MSDEEDYDSTEDEDYVPTGFYLIFVLRIRTFKRIWLFKSDCISEAH